MRKVVWIWKAKIQDISKISEIFVFGKRTAYRHIFNNNIISSNEIQVLKIAEEYKNNPNLLNSVYPSNVI